MDEADYTDLDRQVAGLGEAFARGIKEIASAPAVQRGLLCAALNDLVWTLYIAFADDRDVLHDELVALAGAVRSSSQEHREMAQQEYAATSN